MVSFPSLPWPLTLVLEVRLIGQPPDTEGDPVTATGEIHRTNGTTSGTPGVRVMVA
ncbi:MAG: hypothetical protein ACRDYA_18625 [Egibacteraceae bacterium]